MNLSAPIRDAIVNNYAITDLLATYTGEPSVHTRRPVPGESTYPMVVISPDVAVTDFDPLNGDRPIVVRDVSVYGQHAGTYTTHDGRVLNSYRAVEQIGYALRTMFHRKKHSIVPDGYHVVDLVVSGPISAPADDMNLVGRLVTLTIRLQRIGEMV